MSEELILYIDTETFSEIPIRDGAYRYSEVVEILIVAWALDHPAWGESEIAIEDLTDDAGIGCLQCSDALIDAIANADRIVWHNGGNFDRVVISSNDQIPSPPIEKTEDTMIRAMEHGLPGGLEKLSEIFKLGGDSKHAGGKDFINRFCKPQPKGRKMRRCTKLTHPEEWKGFLAYAGGDIQSMRALRSKLPRWNYPRRSGDNQPSGEYALWQLDMEINQRGFKVDLDLADAALSMIDRVKDNHDAYIEETTFGEVHTAGQRDALLKHLLSWYGVSLPDMRKGTIEKRLNDPDLPDIVKELLAVRLDAAMASTSKYKALLRSVSNDGRLRGTLQFCGAVRTGRWAGRIFQPQNIIRPTKAESQAADEWIEAIKSGIGELVLPNPSRAAAVALRGAIIADEGKKLVCGDLSNIEGRFAAWLAGEDWKLDAFAAFDAGTGHDLYRITAGRILHKSPEDVTEDERQISGKVPELACTYQGAVGAFGTIAVLYGLNLETSHVEEIVKDWREANSKIKQLWYDCDSAARNATLHPGKTFEAGKLAFHRTGEWLLLQLPSGRKLCYAQPAIVDHPKFENATSLSYLGVNSYTRRWERIHTYGGKLFENATQAGARDVLACNMLKIEETGYPIVLDVHDDVIAECPDSPDFTWRKLCAMLASRPWWADERLPLAATGFEAYRWRKD